MQKILMSLRTRVCASLIAAALTFVALSGAWAQTPAQKSPFGVPPPSAANAQSQAVAASPGLIDTAWNWLLETQSKLNRSMAGAVRDLKSENPIAAGGLLVAIAFAYGVLHAAGPGHGKAVISSYVLANEETVRRGIALSFVAAVFQALSAIAFVGVLAVILRQTSLQMRSTEASIETISWGLVAAVGAFMLWRQLSPLISNPSVTAETAAAPTSTVHEHIQAHDPAQQHAHAHGPNCGCGHSHMPAPKDIAGPGWSWKKALPIALSVGIRPCSGAILLLVFALSQGMFWAGVLGTFAMALGTAITVSILAAMAVGTRNWAERRSAPGSVWPGRIQTAAGIAGASLVLILGTAFFIASLKGGSPL